MKIEIMNCFTWYANRVAETVQYTNWSDDFCRKDVKEATDMMLEELKKYIDWDNLTKEEVRELRFMQWSEEQPDLYLIPLYILPILPIGTKLISILGEDIVYDGTNVDKDIRFGCIAYGISITK